METLLLSAFIGLGTALGTLALAHRSGLLPVQQALVTALKDRVLQLESENTRLKLRVAELESENLKHEARIDKLEQLILDARLNEQRPPL